MLTMFFRMPLISLCKTHSNPTFTSLQPPYCIKMVLVMTPRSPMLLNPMVYSQFSVCLILQPAFYTLSDRFSSHSFYDPASFCFFLSLLSFLSISSTVLIFILHCQGSSFLFYPKPLSQRYISFICSLQYHLYALNSQIYISNHKQLPEFMCPV